MTPVVVQLALGSDYACVRKSNGTVFCWGSNDTAQLGMPAGGFSARPVAIAGISDAIDVSAAEQHACALRATGQVLCWGANDTGMLGIGSSSPTPRPTAEPVTGIADGVQITARGFHTCVRTRSGTVMCWGANGNGQLGDGTTMARSTPVIVRGISDAIFIGAGGTTHTCAIEMGGAAVCWGDNAYGEIGDGTRTDRLLPTRVVVPPSGVVQITGGSGGGAHCGTALTLSEPFTCVRTATNNIWCWGDNTCYQLGDNTIASSPSPLMVSGLNDASGLAGRGSLACVIRAGGFVWCWGANGNGQLGTTGTARASPGVVPGVSNAVEVAAGNSFACARDAMGRVFCWGANVSGQLGTGTTGPTGTAMQVVGL
jgi:alpha-tubulin suppressor-like RCC1 family protein